MSNERPKSAYSREDIFPDRNPILFMEMFPIIASRGSRSIDPFKTLRRVVATAYLLPLAFPEYDKAELVNTTLLHYLFLSGIESKEISQYLDLPDADSQISRLFQEINMLQTVCDNIAIIPDDDKDKKGGVKKRRKKVQQETTQDNRTTIYTHPYELIALSMNSGSSLRDLPNLYLKYLLGEVENDPVETYQFTTTQKKALAIRTLVKFMNDGNNAGLKKICETLDIDNQDNVLRQIDKMVESFWREDLTNEEMKAFRFFVMEIFKYRNFSQMSFRQIDDLTPTERAVFENYRFQRGRMLAYAERATLAVDYVFQIKTHNDAIGARTRIPISDLQKMFKLTREELIKIFSREGDLGECVFLN